jgi:hypothetical protein
VVVGDAPYVERKRPTTGDWAALFMNDCPIVINKLAVWQDFFDFFSLCHQRSPAVDQPTPILHRHIYVKYWVGQVTGRDRDARWIFG